ncbi:RDD family protein [Nocardiopsis gilva]
MILDSFISLLIFAVIFVPGIFFSIEIFDAEGKSMDETPEMAVAMLVLILVGVAASFSYFWLTHARSGQPLGKKLMGIKVISLRTGMPPSLGASALRQFIRMMLGLLGWLGSLLNYLWPLWDEPNRQAIHDKAASTRVVKVRGVAETPIQPYNY